MDSNFNWFYVNYERYGNSIISVKHYQEIDKKRLGNHTTRLSKGLNQGDPDCYIVEKERGDK